MPALAPIVAAAAMATGIRALEKLQPGTCVVDTAFTSYTSTAPMLSKPCLDDQSAVLLQIPNDTVLKHLNQWSSGCGTTYTRVGYNDASGKYFEGWISNKLADCLSDDMEAEFTAGPQQSCDQWSSTFVSKSQACGAGNTYNARGSDMCDKSGASCNAVCCTFPVDHDDDDRDDFDRRRDDPVSVNNMMKPPLANKATAATLNIQLCSAWAGTNGGAIKACGAGAKYDADKDDVCDAGGRLCRVFCCDFNDDKAEFAAVLAGLSTTVAEVRKRVQTCDAWAAKAGGAAKACGTTGKYDADSTDFCDAKGLYCPTVCCNDHDDRDINNDNDDFLDEDLLNIDSDD